MQTSQHGSNQKPTEMTDRYTLHHGNNLDILPTIPDNSIDSIVTDPPYELGFMGKKWDASGIAYSVDLWTECLRVLKPGGHLLAFGGTRTYHRMTVAIEDAGFEIRDSIHWLYGSGFPKSLDVSKAIDKAAGAEREVVGRDGRSANESWLGTAKRGETGFGIGEWDITAPATDAAKRWEGWGTALKPAHEPIVLARKPLDGTVANNVLQHGTGALNIDGCRIPTDDRFGGGAKGTSGFADGYEHDGWTPGNTSGRWPANVIIDDWITDTEDDWPRYFYCAKPSKAERNTGADNKHPTVKPLALMRYLIRLITPPDGIVLDPFAGSGTTLAAAIIEGHHPIGIELTDDYLPIIHGRCQHATTQHNNQPQPEPTLFDNHDN